MDSDSTRPDTESVRAMDTLLMAIHRDTIAPAPAVANEPTLQTKLLEKSDALTVRKILRQKIWPASYIPAEIPGKSNLRPCEDIKKRLQKMSATSKMRGRNMEAVAKSAAELQIKGMSIPQAIELAFQHLKKNLRGERKMKARPTMDDFEGLSIHHSGPQLTYNHSSRMKRVLTRDIEELMGSGRRSGRRSGDGAGETKNDGDGDIDGDIDILLEVFVINRMELAIQLMVRSALAQEYIRCSRGGGGGGGGGGGSTTNETKEDITWIADLDEGDKDNLVAMVTQAVQHHAGLTDAAKQDIATKFQLMPQQVDEVVAWVYSGSGGSTSTSSTSGQGGGRRTRRRRKHRKKRTIKKRHKKRKHNKRTRKH